MHSYIVENNLKSDNSLVRIYVFYFISILVLLPSVTFNLIQAEVFPWALLYCAFFIRQINFYLIIFIIYLIINGLMFSLWNSRLEAGEFLRSFIAYLNVLIIFDVLIRSNQRLIKRWIKLFKYFFFFLLILGLLQSFGVLKDVDGLFKFFIPRAYSYSLEFMGGRGVTLLTSEPARAGIELVFIYVVVRFVYIKRSRLLVDFVMLLFIVFIIKSAIAVAFFLIYLLIVYRIKFFMVMLPIMGVFVVLLQATLVDNRFGILLLELSSKADISEIFHMISQSSGHRILSVWLSYFFGFSYPFGGGIGNWEHSSILSVVLSGINTDEVRYFNVHGGGEAVAFRASGFISNLLYDAGVFGVLFIFFYLYKKLKLVGKLSIQAKEILALFIVKILFFGSVGNPISWVALAIIMRYYELNEKK